MSESAGQSKSAARRARAKAVAAATAAEEVPEPKAEPKEEPKVKAKGKAKAEPKAEPKAAPKEEPKAKAKGKAKAEPKAAAQAELKPAEPKAKPAAKSEGKKKAPKAVKKQDEDEEQDQPKKKVVEDGPPIMLDDGAGGEWEAVSGLSKKAASRKAREEEQKELERLARAAAGGAKVKEGQVIPGMNYAPEPTAKAKAEGTPKEKTGPKVTAAEALAAAPPPAAKESDNTSVTVQVPEGKIGRIIGPKGANLKLITEKTGVKKIDTEDTQVVIMGSAQSVNLAEMAVKELIEKGYMSLAFEDFKEESVMAHPTVFPDLIGKGGAVIRKIKEALNVEVGIPQVPKNAPPGKQFKVTLAGAREPCEKAKKCVENIIMYGHDEITHPGMVHEEMTEIQEWQYKFLIGSKGSEMRHICNSFHVKMSIPREYSENRNVVIVGEAKDVEKAKAYAEKVIYQAEQPRAGGRGSDGPAQDDGGGDDEIEDWMSPYMYKRR